MRFVINPAGNRIVDATPEETHALRPALRASFRRWRANEADIDDICQNVEIITWQALSEGRVHVPDETRPADALWQWMYGVAWNQWRNHSRRRWLRCEVSTNEVPDVASQSPVPRLEARDTLRRIATDPQAADLLLASLTGERSTTPKSTFWHRVGQARKWAREVDAGKIRMPDPPTPKHRKKRL
jgi:DNA-directed RNA polymerase specialized sigma24 family protein